MIQYVKDSVPGMFEKYCLSDWEWEYLWFCSIFNSLSIYVLGNDQKVTLNSACLNVLGTLMYITFILHSSPESVCLNFPPLFPSPIWENTLYWPLPRSLLQKVLLYQPELSHLAYSQSQAAEKWTTVLSIQGASRTPHLFTQMFRHIHLVTEKVPCPKTQIKEGSSVTGFFSYLLTSSSLFSVGRMNLSLGQT